MHARTKAYLSIARRAQVEGEEFYSCNAIWDHKELGQSDKCLYNNLFQGDGGLCWIHEAIGVSEGCSANAQEIKEIVAIRVLMLCFMAAMVETGDA